MKYLFSEENLRILKSLNTDDTLFAFDFDGTLAPIHQNYKDAKISSSTELLLINLSMTLKLSIISGRSLSDLQSRVPSHFQYLIGNHGAEGLPCNWDFLDSSIKDMCQKLKMLVMQIFSYEFSTSDIEIEDKLYTLTLHYKGAPNLYRTQAIIKEKIAQLEPIARIIPGKDIFNIIPKEASNKGQALLELMQGSKSKFAFYIGDDDTDEDVFAINDPRIFTVRVGKKEGSQAKYFVEHQGDIDTLLQCLIEMSTPEKTNKLSH